MKPRHRSARAAVLWGIGGLLALQLGLAVAIECGLWRFRDPFYAHKLTPLRRVWADLAVTHPTGPKNLAVVLGSSRVGNGLSGATVADGVSATLGERWTVFNLAAPGAGPLYELMSLRRVLAEGIRPDFVLVEVFPMQLSAPPDDTVMYESTYLRTERLSLSDFDVLERCGLPQTAAWRKAWWQDWAVPWHAHRFSILSELAPKFLPAGVQQDWCKRCDPAGWVPLPPDPNVPPAVVAQVAERVRAQYEPVLTNFRLSETGRRAIRAVLDECRQQGIPAALIMLPEGSRLRNWYPPTAWAEMDALLAELQRDYQVPLINGRLWAADGDFPDGIHLYTHGADAYSRRLSQEVAPLLRRAGRPVDAVPVHRPAVSE